MVRCRLGRRAVYGNMIPDGGLEGVIEKIGRQLSARSLGRLVDVLQGASDRFDLLLASLWTRMS